MAAISKEEIVEFANMYYSDNYVAVYKHTGEKEVVEKIVKPPITPLNVDRETESEFARTIINTPAPQIEPVFLDFNNDFSQLNFEPGILRIQFD